MPANGNVNKLVGSWTAVITAVNQGTTFPGLITFTSDGIFLASEPPSPFESPGYGNWISVGSGIAYTFHFLFGGSEGKLSGRAKVNGAFTYDAGSDSWNGPFKTWGMEADDHLTLIDHGTVTITRIAVEVMD